MLIHSGLPKEYRDGRRTWGSVRHALGEKITAAEALRRRAHRGLYLTGPAGSFKTSFAATFLADSILFGEEGRYVFVPSLFTELYKIYANKDDNRSRADVVERYAMARNVVMDDMGKEKPSAHAAEVLMEILDWRYHNAAGWTIITSNFDIDSLGERLRVAVGEELSDPIMRRISELCVPIPMGLL